MAHLLDKSKAATFGNLASFGVKYCMNVPFNSFYELFIFFI